MSNLIEDKQSFLEWFDLKWILITWLETFTLLYIIPKDGKWTKSLE